MAKLPLREAAIPVEIEDENARDYARPHGLTAEQQEALFYSRKRRKLRMGFYNPPAEPEE